MSTTLSNRLRQRGIANVIWLWMTAAAALVLITTLVVANTRFVQLAFASQPECVKHTKTGERESNTYQAAKSAC